MLPLLSGQAGVYWPDYTSRHYLAAQVEQESKCNPRAANKNAKNNNEWGAGYGQITRTNKFDAMAELKARHRQALGAWSWSNPYDPVLNLRGLVLKNRDNYAALDGWFVDEDNRNAAMLIAYNGGFGRVRSDRILCRSTPGCDPSRWWGHVEHTSRLPKRSANGYRLSFFEINREYPHMIMRVRAPKYRSYFDEN